NRQILYRKQRCLVTHVVTPYSLRLRSCGFKASLRPSPIRLIASTVRRIATPGHTLIHQASRIMVREAPIMNPQLIMLRSPSPRKESADSVRMAVATMKDAETIIGDMALGRICDETMRDGFWPITMAAN